MRRYLLVFMMLLLPLQWSWAAAASVCAHESGASHFGHHEHQHTGGALADHADAEAGTGDASSLGAHPDCQVCHGIGAACVRLGEAGRAPWPGTSALPDYHRHLPDPPADALLRPPPALVA